MAEGNPYTPPAAEVADPVLAPRARPRFVNLAIGLIGAAVLLRVLVDLKYLQDMDFQVNDQYRLLGSAIVNLMSVLFCVLMARGFNWARILQLVFTLLAFANFCFAIGFMTRHGVDPSSPLFSPRFLLGGVLPILLNLVACYLLFFYAGNWFARRG